MKKKMYVIYDRVAQQVASSVILSDRDEVLTRDLKASKLPGTMESEPGDFDIMCIGELETSDCSINSKGAKMILNLGALKNGTKEN